MCECTRNCVIMCLHIQGCMCIYAYICVHIYICTSACVCVHMRRHASVCVHMYNHALLYRNVCAKHAQMGIHVYKTACVCLCMEVCLHTLHLHAQVHTHVCVCVHITSSYHAFVAGFVAAITGKFCLSPDEGRAWAREQRRQQPERHAPAPEISSCHKVFFPC